MTHEQNQPAAPLVDAAQPASVQPTDRPPRRWHGLRRRDWAEIAGAGRLSLGLLGYIGAKNEWKRRKTRGRGAAEPGAAWLDRRPLPDATAPRLPATGGLGGAAELPAHLHDQPPAAGWLQLAVCNMQKAVSSGEREE